MHSRAQGFRLTQWQLELRVLWNGLARATLCRIGWHTKATGVGLDACARGCGFMRRPDVLQPYEVTLRDGSIHRVHAVNRCHAASLVVHGGTLGMDPDGAPIGEVLVHRANIRCVVPVYPERERP